MPKITIYTQVYNAGAYLEPCITSVLNQTYSDFEWILVDSCSTDGSTDAIAECANRDRRVKPVFLTKNDVFAQFEITEKMATGEFYTCIDHDDWWESNYLERLLNFLNDNSLDLAMTGTMSHVGSSQNTLRKLEAPVVLTLQKFAQYYPQFWTFPSTRWASLMPLTIYKDAAWEEQKVGNRILYGGDTVLMLTCLKKCRRIGIDNTALYHYRIHPESQSFQYNLQRFDDNVACYERIREFLQFFDTLDNAKQGWLKSVHIHSMLETFRLLKKSQLSQGEKLKECARIVRHPLTSHVLTYDGEATKQWYSSLYTILSEAARKRAIESSSFTEILAAVAPPFSDAAGLFAQDPELLGILLCGDQCILGEKLLELIVNKRYIKQYDMAGILRNTLPEDSPLRIVKDSKFFWKNKVISQKILAKDYLFALEQMTELLLSGGKLYGEETFLQIYLTLAALENQEPAFIFGKIRLAQMYQQTGRLADCRNVISEVEEMGAGDHPEVVALRLAAAKMSGGEI